ncbi:MAG: hypothetical protein R3Y09_04205 [Clostridia bacterium]
MIYNAEILISDNKLTVQGCVATSNKYTKYAFYLYQNNRVIEKIGYKILNTHTFEVCNTGLYHVRIFVQEKEHLLDEYIKTTCDTKGVLYTSSEDVDTHLDFINSDYKKENKILPFYQLKYPYQDFCFVMAKGEQKTSDFKTFSKKHSLNVRELEKNKSIILYNGDLYNQNDKMFVFSGMTKLDDTLIYGSNDIKDYQTSQKLEEGIGNFSMILGSGNKFSIQTDYFGISKLYYYNEKDYFIATNRYHLLTLAMSELNIVKTLDSEIFLANLIGNHQTTMQTFSRKLSIKHTYLLPVDRKFEVNIKSKEVRILTTSLYDVLSVPPKYDEKEYNSLLEKAEKEIIQNATACLNHPYFENYMVDVTGGMDARMVLCALSRVPNYQEKVVANFYKYPNTPEDFDIALKILSKHRLSLKSPPKNEEFVAPLNREDAFLSVKFGESSVFYDAESNQKPYLKACRFGGGYGEIVARHYYTRAHFNSLLDNFANDDTAFDYITKLYGCSKPTRILSFNYYAKVLKEEILLLPGKSNLEKYENSYLYYRNAFHLNVALLSEFLSTDWGILQSKELFKIKYMVFYNQKNIKLQLDMLYKLNPEIASLPFGGDMNEKQRNVLNEKYNCYPVVTDFDENLLLELEIEWNCNNDKLKAVNVNRNATKNYNSEFMLSVLQEIITKNKELKNENMASIINILKKDEYTAERMCVCRKIMQVYHAF